ncbi:MAG: IS1595 family transposase [Geminicoccaceae bacterium]|nr:IS1595 family transposase [Geminicoccaceae bacterium]
MQRFNTDEAAREYLERIRWPNGPVCPHCGNADGAKLYEIAANPERKVRAGLRECGECKKQFTVTVGTIFEDSKIPLRKWLVAWYMLCTSKKGVSAKQIERMLDLGSYRSAWFLMHRIRYALSEPAFSTKLGEDGGTVEVDEAYVGGKPRKGAKEKAKPGRGTKKAPVLVLVERDGAARSMPVERVNAKTLKPAIRENVDRSAKIMTDEWTAYGGIGEEFKGGHETVNHGAGEYARDDVNTNTAESYFALLKRGVYGTFHHVSKTHLHRYCDEFSFRWTYREVTDGERTRIGMARMNGKRLMLRQPKSPGGQNGVGRAVAEGLPER